ncbi:MAG: hypothetical protein LBC88_01535 [Spirochaetaceae bacterium]|jgi:hypothetical protein|nr:hypothetical protein [Spirochaetaceae bacterium]
MKNCVNYGKNPVRKMTGGGGALLTALLVAGAVFLAGCGDSFVDTHTLPLVLIGTWKIPVNPETGVQPFTSDYVITATTVAFDDGFSETNYDIHYIINFNETRGGIVVKKQGTENFTVIWFKDLTATSVVLGNAADTTNVIGTDSYTDPNTGETVTYEIWGDPKSVNSTDTVLLITDLEEAKLVFSNDPERFLGGSAQKGSTQVKQR